MLTVRADEDLPGRHEPAVRSQRRCPRRASSWRSCARPAKTRRFALPPEVCAGVAGARLRSGCCGGRRRDRSGGSARGHTTCAASQAHAPLVAQGAAVDAPYAKLEQLEPGIARVLAHNPSAFTYTGTQTYLVGDRRGRGDRPRARPARASRCARSTAIGGRRGRRDHVHPHPPRPQPGGAAARRARPARRSSAARRSRWRRSARAPTPRSTAIIAPTACSRDGEAIEVDGERRRSRSRLRATPPTISASLTSGALFTGDHVMGWSTTVVVPPDGDMADYMASLDKLRQRDDRGLLSGARPAGDNPQQLCPRADRSPDAARAADPALVGEQARTIPGDGRQRLPRPRSAAGLGGRGIGARASCGPRAAGAR